MPEIHMHFLFFWEKYTKFCFNFTSLYWFQALFTLILISERWPGYFRTGAYALVGPVLTETLYMVVNFQEILCWIIAAFKWQFILEFIPGCNEWTLFKLIWENWLYLGWNLGKMNSNKVWTFIFPHILAR